jgi:hypothetical protein
MDLLDTESPSRVFKVGVCGGRYYRLRMFEMSKKIQKLIRSSAATTVEKRRASNAGNLRLRLETLERRVLMAADISQWGIGR